MILRSSDFARYITLSKEAIYHTILIKLAWSAPSPSLAQKTALNCGWNYKLALACRNLTVIKRDWGNVVFKIAVLSAREYYQLDCRDLCFCICHQCHKCFSNHTHNGSYCGCKCHHCQCCRTKLCFCYCHDCPSCENDIKDKVCSHRHHCEKCRKTHDDFIIYEDEELETIIIYDKDEYEDISEDDEDCFKESTCEVSDIEKNIISAEERLLEVKKRIEQATDKKLDVTYVDSEKLIGKVDKNGKIQISKGLIEGANNDELAFVISHEDAHHDFEHLKKKDEKLKEIINEIFKVMDEVPGRGVKKMLQQAVALAVGLGTGLLATREISREYEEEADGVAVDRMKKAGYDPKAAATFIEREGDKKKGFFKELVSTHPSGKDRSDKIKLKIDKQK